MKSRRNLDFFIGAPYRVGLVSQAGKAFERGLKAVLRLSIYRYTLEAASSDGRPSHEILQNGEPPLTRFRRAEEWPYVCREDHHLGIPCNRWRANWPGCSPAFLRLREYTNVRSDSLACSRVAIFAIYSPSRMIFGSPLCRVTRKIQQPNPARSRFLRLANRRERPLNGAERNRRKHASTTCWECLRR